MYTLSLHDALPISILKRRGCLTVPRLTLMSLIKMMLVMVSVAAISKTFGLLRFLLRPKGLGAKEWNNSLKTKLSLLPKKLFRIRMSRNFGMKMLTMTNLSTECLIQLTKLGYDATPFNQILKQNAKREMRLR